MTQLVNELGQPIYANGASHSADTAHCLLCQNPRAMMTDEVKTLFDRAFERQPHINVPVLRRDLMRALPSDNVAILIGVEHHGFQALSIVSAHGAGIASGPQVLHFFCDGTEALRDLMIRETVGWIRAKGYDRFYASSTRPNCDRAWQKIFSLAGRIEEMGKLYRIEIQ